MDISQMGLSSRRLAEFTRNKNYDGFRLGDLLAMALKLRKSLPKSYEDLSEFLERDPQLLTPGEICDSIASLKQAQQVISSLEVYIENHHEVCPISKI